MKASSIKEVPLVQVGLVWDEAEPYLRRAVDSVATEEYLAFIKGRLFTGMEQLWQLRDDIGEILGYATTSIYTRNGLTTTVVINLGVANELEAFVSYLSGFEVWAKGKNIDYIEVVGRKGWEKVLRSEGFEHNYTSLIKPVIKELH